MEDLVQKELEVSAVIGFKGDVVDGLILHPDNEHLIYPLGSTIIVRDIISRSQQLLSGHDNNISVITVSPSGRYIASGQETYMGFQADIIIWDFETMGIKHRFKLHKVLVQSLCFSPDEMYLGSLGGQDDNRLVIWDVETGKAVCGNAAGSDKVTKIKFYNHDNNKLVSVQNYGVKLWTIDYQNKKLTSIPVNLGNMKRVFTNLIIDASDTFAYCPTKTGDILEISLEKALYKRLGPIKTLFSQGIMCIDMLLNGDIIVGCGDGTIAKIDRKVFRVKTRTEVMGGVSSMSMTADGTYMFVGSTQSNIYWCDTDLANPELRNTCHYTRINHITFPKDYSKLFATCSLNDIRVWNAETRQEMLRIQVPNLTCYSVEFMADGKSIVSGWDDGKIRTFLPQSGKLFYVINDAHNHGVTALTTTLDNSRIVSGGMEGEVRVWRIGRQTQTLEISLKEHRGRVNDIRVNKKNDQALSASADGSCIIWDLTTFTRVMCLFEATMFKQVLYHPDESQILTTGSDRKITYYDTFDGQAIRMIEAAEDGEMEALAITKEGEHFVSGGGDKILRLWDYDEGLSYYAGIGHPGGITKIAFSPDQRTIVSVGSEGAIFMWKVPEKVYMAKADNEMPTLNQ